MDPVQTAPLGAVLSGFIVFASMVKVFWSAFEYMQASRRYKQTIFSGQKVFMITPIHQDNGFIWQAELHKNH